MTNVWKCSKCKAELPNDEYSAERKKKHLVMHKKKGTEITEESFTLLEKA